jgi:hypothetical protein
MPLHLTVTNLSALPHLNRASALKNLRKKAHVTANCDMQDNLIVAPEVESILRCPFHDGDDMHKMIGHKEACGSAVCETSLTMNHGFLAGLRVPNLNATNGPHSLPAASLHEANRDRVGHMPREIDARASERVAQRNHMLEVAKITASRRSNERRLTVGAAS